MSGNNLNPVPETHFPSRVSVEPVPILSIDTSTGILPTKIPYQVLYCFYY